MKNIYLIGMPSSGKSTLGKRLARALHYHFVDTDRLIIREEGRSVADIFAQKGEAYFREAEARVLRTIRPGGSLVIATGGGMPCFHDNMAYIKATGLSVFLDVAPEELAQRMITHARQFPTTTPERPLFDADDQALLDVLRQKQIQRLPVYQQADIQMTGDITEQDLLTLLGDWL
ncbi:shikimate kinase [uncultured Fibrella sp.]|uniref:shikimate kinase n=1 Tax=uncultured Fibrella sp. TaxID=1284596 RepID=UPI0035CCA1C2